MNATLTKIKVTDNFLPDKHFSSLQNLLLSPRFPWSYSCSKVQTEIDDLANYQMVHVFKDASYDDNASPYADQLNIFLRQLNMQALFRIKANLEGYRTSEPYYSNFHVDCSDEQLYVPTIDGHKHKEVKDMTTGIYYVNTCNGYTEFEDGTIVNSVGNRFVSFPASTKHRGVSQTDTKARVVINFNYW